MIKIRMTLSRLAALSVMGVVFMSADECGGAGEAAADITALKEQLAALKSKCETLETKQTTMDGALGNKLDNTTNVPRPFALTTQERTAIKAFQKDAVILDSTDNHYYKWDGAKWVKLHSYLPAQIPTREPKFSIVTAVPTNNAGYIQGDTVLVTANNQFHEFDGTAWALKHTVGIGALSGLTVAQLGHLVTLGSTAGLNHLVTLGNTANLNHLVTLGNTANLNHLATLGNCGANFAHLAALGNCGADFGHLATLGSTPNLANLATLGAVGAAGLANLATLGGNGSLAAIGTMAASFNGLGGGGGDADKIIKLNVAGNGFELGHVAFSVGDQGNLLQLLGANGIHAKKDELLQLLGANSIHDKRDDLLKFVGVGGGTDISGHTAALNTLAGIQGDLSAIQGNKVALDALARIQGDLSAIQAYKADLDALQPHSANLAKLGALALNVGNANKVLKVNGAGNDFELGEVAFTGVERGALLELIGGGSIHEKRADLLKFVGVGGGGVVDISGHTAALGDLAGKAGLLNDLAGLVGVGAGGCAIKINGADDAFEAVALGA